MKKKEHNINGYGIYLISNLINGKKYVGATGSTQSFYIRFRYHKITLRGNYHKNPHLQSAWNKYGEDNFQFRILEECPDDMLDTREQSWINYYDSMNPKKGYNLREGGDHGKMSEDAKNRISKKLKGVKKSKEQVEKLRKYWQSKEGLKRKGVVNIDVVEFRNRFA